MSTRKHSVMIRIPLLARLAISFMATFAVGTLAAVATGRALSPTILTAAFLSGLFSIGAVFLVTRTRPEDRA
ncbi:MAG: hypothetical protein IT428_13685 [Planctomycetaceae bacterium]|nr:hypothetical protein [Planctomycetaceae bacterium]